MTVNTKSILFCNVTPFDFVHAYQKCRLSLIIGGTRYSETSLYMYSDTSANEDNSFRNHIR